MHSRITNMPNIGLEVLEIAFEILKHVNINNNNNFLHGKANGTLEIGNCQKLQTMTSHQLHL